MNKPATKRSQQESALTNTEDLGKRIATAKLELNTALLTGEPTASLRSALRALEAEQAAIAHQQAAQIAAKQALAKIAADRIAEAAATIKEARDKRIAAIATRFGVPARRVFDSRDSFHA